MPAEDGARNYYYLENQPGLVHRWGSKDGKITAVNSGAGTVPATVITDKNGVADFDLVYPLPSSIWTVARVRASTIVLGTETVGQVIFTLPPMCSDTPLRWNM